jgi:hypothetical protein
MNKIKFVERTRYNCYAVRIRVFPNLFLYVNELEESSSIVKPNRFHR